MDITVFGAGNLGLACCAKLSEKNTVTLYTRRPHRTQEEFSFHYEDESETSATFKVTDQLQKACSAPLLLCTYPAFLRQQFVKDIEPYVAAGTLVGFIPGYGGVEFFSQQLLMKKVVIFGFQRVPYVCRSNWEERVAQVLSAKTNLYVAALPKSQTESVASLMQQLFNIPVHPLKEFLALTLAPSNPLLHTTGAYGVFKNYAAGKTYPEPLMFYDEWNDDTSRMLLEYDEELQSICRGLSPLDLSEVVPLSIYYESPTAAALTKKLKSIEAFKVVKVPLNAQDDGTYFPNWNDRMFIEDYPYGVAIFKDIAIMLGIETPVIDTLLNFYKQQTGTIYFTPDGDLAKDALRSAAPRTFGLNTPSKLIDFYQKEI